ncbi:hypothetical protein GLYMA_12G137301v4 [Glycine max]|nr:hypothetical protein GLYMA_12G137301v4 [Glycine max]KAH1143050.1 hypothetical protein GYH30_033653 [Glycine max]
MWFSRHFRFLSPNSMKIECREGGRTHQSCDFYLKNSMSTAMIGILDKKSADSGDRVADNQEAAKLE